jgi:plasmid stability protein
MSKMIQIRHVPDALHKQLRVRAAEAGMTLSDFLRTTLEREASKMTNAEIRARLAALEPVDTGEATVDVIRAMREERDAELDARIGRVRRR